MKHLILPIGSSPYEGAHQSAIIVDLSAELPLPAVIDGVMEAFNAHGFAEFILQVSNHEQEPEVLVDETGFLKRWPS